MHINIYEMVLYAALGGILPAIFWLWFWLKEDSLHPEPKLMIVIAFISGMLMVPVALVLEVKYQALSGLDLTYGVTNSIVFGLFVLAAIEEILKYLGASIVAFRNKSYDEPVDAMIYLISAALGFAALENSLFLGKLITSDVETTFILLSNNLRFMGATILHVVTSGILGGIIALGYYKKSHLSKVTHLIIGLTTAIILHTAFNFFIIRSSDLPILVFSGLWLGAIFLIILFEKVKRIRKPNLN